MENAGAGENECVDRRTVQIHLLRYSVVCHFGAVVGRWGVPRVKTDDEGAARG